MQNPKKIAAISAALKIFSDLLPERLDVLVQYCDRSGAKRGWVATCTQLPLVAGDDHWEDAVWKILELLVNCLHQRRNGVSSPVGESYIAPIAYLRAFERGIPRKLPKNMAKLSDHLAVAVRVASTSKGSIKHYAEHFINVRQESSEEALAPIEA